MIKFQVDYRATDEMLEPTYKGLKDTYGVLALTAEKRKAFANRPYREQWNVFCQKVFSSDGIAFGGEIQFPLLVDMPDGRKIVLSGSTSFVAKDYRKTEVGGHFHDYTESVSPGFWTCGAGMSQMMVRLHKYWKTPLFLMPRLIMLFKSRSVVEMKLKGFAAKIVSLLIDCLASLWYGLIALVCRIRIKSYAFEKITVDQEDVLSDVATLIAADTHKYCEVHDVPWLKWMMTESFDSAGPMELTVVRKNGRLVAFYMTKKRFHEQASTRGFKNVWLASIMEWGAVPEEEKNLKWFVLRAALSFRKTMDAFELVTVDQTLLSFFKKIGARQVGEGNYTISPPRGTKPPYFEEMKNPSNWRLRLAMGDAGLN